MNAGGPAQSAGAHAAPLPPALVDRLSDVLAAAVVADIRQFPTLTDPDEKPSRASQRVTVQGIIRAVHRAPTGQRHCFRGIR